jgi:hypothetical protein
MLNKKANPPKLEYYCYSIYIILLKCRNEEQISGCRDWEWVWNGERGKYGYQHSRRDVSGVEITQNSNNVDGYRYLQLRKLCMSTYNQMSAHKTQEV